MDLDAYIARQFQDLQASYHRQAVECMEWGWLKHVTRAQYERADAYINAWAYLAKHLGISED